MTFGSGSVLNSFTPTPITHVHELPKVFIKSKLIRQTINSVRLIACLQSFPNTVLEPTGVAVTGTPSIYLEFKVVHNNCPRGILLSVEPRSEINKLRNIDGEPSINDVLDRGRTCDRNTCSYMSLTVIILL